ncbi:MAG: response regulator [Lachnospiraceae bacterium]|nr:response regulator [Lachnospiraceae bacterium]
MVNLLTNAVKYTEKGSVILKIGCAGKENDRVKMYISVTDTGIGIRPEEMDKLFSAFDRLDASRNKTIEGTGLGLSITRRLLTMMDTDLQVESVYNEGSRFYFYLWQDISDPDEIGDVDPVGHTGIMERPDINAKSFIAPGMDGIDTIKKMASEYPDKFAITLVICLTASAVSGDREKLMAAGFTDYLSKPVNVEEMEETFNELREEISWIFNK